QWKPCPWPLKTKAFHRRGRLCIKVGLFGKAEGLSYPLAEFKELRSAMMRRFSSLFLSALISLLSAFAFAADIPGQNQPAKFHYQRPPKVIADVLESPAPPLTLVSPTREHVLVIDSLRHPPISDLAQPMLRIGGLRINPATN